MIVLPSFTPQPRNAGAILEVRQLRAQLQTSRNVIPFRRRERGVV
jgi:hypothetical protein